MALNIPPKLFIITATPWPTGNLLTFVVSFEFWDDTTNLCTIILTTSLTDVAFT